MGELNRRDFIKKSLVSGMALTVPRLVTGAFANRQILGANNDIRIGIIGLRSRGSVHIDSFRNIPGVRVVALCDVDQEFLDREAVKFKERNEPVKTFRDVRKLLEAKDIDAVAMATPVHWHALISIWACQAGKHVYVEKPVCHSIWEGRKLVEAARKYNRIVQAGLQNRSDVGLREAVAYLKEGHLGKILYGHGVWYKNREGIGRVTGPQPIPPTVDYNLWIGPAKMKPLMRKNLHYDWHWFWDVGDGEMGNLGVHQIDDCRFAMGLDGFPKRVISVGGRYGFDDDGQTPNTQFTLVEYDHAPIIFEARNLPQAKGLNMMDHFRGTREGNIIQCEGGYLLAGRGGGSAYDNNNTRIKQFPGDGGGLHQSNFIEAVRNHDRSLLHTEIEQGFISSAICHMANISHRLGKDEDVEQIKTLLAACPEAQETTESMHAHLIKNEIDLTRQPLTCGPFLDWHPNKDEFMGPWARKANKYLKRKKYRKPFLVPKNV